LAPTVSYGGDCGELITCAYTLGVAHPTGYPLYLMVGKLFTTLPLRDVAYRMNLMSALFGALSAGALFVILAITTGKLIPSIIGALSFASGYGVWSQAVIAEVYTFNVFLIALLVLLALVWADRRDIRLLYTLAFILGLSLGAHGMTMLTAPAFLVWFLINRNNEQPFRVIVIALLCGWAGALVLCYLPLRAITNPPINWGNPRTWEAFVAHITARQFGNLLLGSSPAQLPTRLLNYALFLGAHFRLFALFLVAGLLLLLFGQPKLFLLCFLLLLANSGLFLTFDQPGAYFQLLPSFLIYGVFVGYAWAVMENRLQASFCKTKGLVAVMLTLAGGISWCAQVVYALPDVNMRDNYHAVQDVQQVLREAPQRAVIVSGFDQIWFTLLYYRWVTGVRTDLAIEHTGNVERVLQQYPHRQMICPMFPPTRLPQGYYFDPVGTFGYLRQGRPSTRYADIAPSSLYHRFRLSDGKTLELIDTRLNPPFMRREGMATLHLYWRVSRHFRQKVAGLIRFEFKGLRNDTAGASLSSSDRILLSSDRFSWTQYHLLGEDGDIGDWQLQRVVEDRCSIRPPWRVVEGIYSLKLAVVARREAHDVTDYRPPSSMSPADWAHVGEIEIYMQ